MELTSDETARSGTTQKKPRRENANMDIEDSPDNETQTTSTLTESTFSGETLEQMCLKNPQMLKEILANNPHIMTQTQSTTPTEVVAQQVVTPTNKASEDDWSL